MSRSPNGKLEIQKILTQGPSLSTNLFSFPIPTRVPDHPPVTSSLSRSHTLPDSRVQTSSNRSPPCLTLSLSLTSFPFFLFPFPFPRQIKKSFSPDPECSWRDEGKNWFPIPSFVFFCLIVVIRDKKKWYGYAVNLCLSSRYSTIKWFASGL